MSIDPMCRSCRNFSIESANVGFPCAIQPKGPDAEGCSNFEAQASANPDLLRIIQDAAGQNQADAIALGLAARYMNSPHPMYTRMPVAEFNQAYGMLNSGIVSISSSVNSQSMTVRDRYDQTGEFRCLDTARLPKPIEEYASIAEIRSAIADLPQTQITGIDRGSAEGSYASIPLRDRLGIPSNNDIELNDLNAIPSEHPHITTHRIDARNLPNGSYDMACRQPTYFPKDFPNAVAMTGIVIHADEPFEPSEEVKALFGQPKTWRDRFLNFMSKLRGDRT